MAQMQRNSGIIAENDDLEGLQTYNANSGLRDNGEVFQGVASMHTRRTGYKYVRKLIKQYLKKAR